MLISLRRNRLVIALWTTLVVTLGVQTATAEEVVASVETTLDAMPSSPSTEAADPAIAEDPSPVPTIETFHLGLLQIMKDAKELGFQGRIDRLAPLMDSVFDLDFMASKTVGGHWRKLSDADKQRWRDVFAHMTVANYAGRFTGYTGEEFLTLGVEESQRGQQLVLTKIAIPAEEDVQLNYRLRKTEAGWRVIDVYLDGTVSELALRRSEYSTALKREGFEELVASIETKIEDMKAKGLVDG